MSFPLYTKRGTRGTLVQSMLDASTDESRQVKRLTEWELSFLESISDVWDRRGELTERQFETLERIYTEKIS